MFDRPQRHRLFVVVARPARSREDGVRLLFDACLHHAMQRVVVTAPIIRLGVQCESAGARALSWQCPTPPLPDPKAAERNWATNLPHSDTPKLASVVPVVPRQ